jgi:hypothetical protein
VRPEAHRLHDLPDGACLHELPAFARGPVLEPLAVADRVDALRLRLHPADLGELLEGGDARLVGHVVLAVAHDPDAEGRPLVRDPGAHHELDLRVLEDLALVLREPGPRVALAEGRGQLGLLRVEGERARRRRGRPLRSGRRCARGSGRCREAEARRCRGRRLLLGAGARWPRRAQGGGRGRPDRRLRNSRRSDLELPMVLASLLPWVHCAPARASGGLDRPRVARR